MKKLICLALIILAFAACKKDNQNGSIVGKWTYSTDTLKTGINGGALNVSSVNAFSTGAYLQFNSDGTGRNQYSSSYYSAFTYTKTGNQVSITYPEIKITIDRATYDYPARTQTLTIKTLTKSNLTLLFDSTGELINNSVHTYQVQYLTR